MFPSSVNSIAAPIITGAPVENPITGQPPTPGVIAQQVMRNCAIRVRNNAFATYVLIAFDSAVLQAYPARAMTYQLPAGGVETFVLAKGQSLFVSAPSGEPDGTGAIVSWHIFEQFPVD